MEIDPHTLQQILLRIEQQMRCPQCGKKVHVNFQSVRVIVQESLLLQLRCDACNAYIVLHASMQGAEKMGIKEEGMQGVANASSFLQVSEREVEMLKSALQEVGGSFNRLFEKYGKK